MQPELPAPRIVLLGPGNEERTITLVPLPYVVGRSSACDLSLTDALVSSRHGEFLATTDGLAFRDLESRNGSRLNGSRLPVNEIVPLRKGDRIQIGSTQLVVESTGESALSQPPEAYTTGKAPKPAGFQQGVEPAEAVWREKRRKDRVRRQVAGMVRLAWADVWDAVRLTDVLEAAAVPRRPSFAVGGKSDGMDPAATGSERGLLELGKPKRTRR